jgi:TetR/AcrR family transcriptional repressor of uid operon
MVQHYFGNYPRERVLLCTEIMSEARRNPEIARISASFDADVRKWLLDLLRAAVACGDIPGDVDLEGAVTMLTLIVDGVWWRRALDPQFNAAAVVPIFMDTARHLLRARPKIVTNKVVTGGKGRNVNNKSVPDTMESTL